MFNLLNLPSPPFFRSKQVKNSNFIWFNPILCLNIVLLVVFELYEKDTIPHALFWDLHFFHSVLCHRDPAILLFFTHFLLLCNYSTSLYLLSMAFGCFQFGATVNNVSTTILVHVSWHMCEILVSVTQECTYWVLGHTDVQSYTMWLNFWAPNEGITASCPRWECEQDLVGGTAKEGLWWKLSIYSVHMAGHLWNETMVSWEVR